MSLRLYEKLSLIGHEVYNQLIVYHHILINLDVFVLAGRVVLRLVYSTVLNTYPQLAPESSLSIENAAFCSPRTNLIVYLMRNFFEYPCLFSVQEFNPDIKQVRNRYTISSLRKLNSRACEQRSFFPIEICVTWDGNSRSIFVLQVL